MNSLIVNSFLRRWGLIIGLCSVVHVIMTFVNANNSRDNFFFPLILFIGPVALSLDLTKGLARVVVLLPIRKKEIVKTWWWIGVGLPVVLISILTIVTSCIAALWNHGTTVQWASIVQTLILAFTSISIMYFALTGLPNNPAEAQSRSGKSAFFGALWGLSIGGSMLLFQLLERNSSQIEGSYFAVLLVGMALSRWGYLRTDAMLSARSTGRSENQPIKTDQKRSFFDFDSKATGFKHFTMTNMKQTLVFSVIFIIGVGVFQTIFSGFAGYNLQKPWIDSAIVTVQSQGMILVIMPSFLLATKLVASRVFRTLPLTVNELANQFFKAAALSIISQNVLIFGIVATLSTPEEGLKNLSHFLVLGCGGTLMLPVILRFGLRPLTFGIIFPIVGILSASRMLGPDLISLSAAPAIGLAIILISRFFTIRILRNSSNAYRQIGYLPFGANVYGKG